MFVECTMLDSRHSPMNDAPSLMLNGIGASAIRSELERILRSRVFIHSHRIRRFLQFIVEECLLEQQHRLKEYLIGLEVFNRLDTFDPRVDSIVRVEARRLRAKLAEYYDTEGREDEVRIELRKGSYVPLFEYRRAGAYPYGLDAASARGSSVVFEPLAADGTLPDGSVAEVVQRLFHLLVKNGCFQVVPPSPQTVEHQLRKQPDFTLRGSVDQRPDQSLIVALQLLNPTDDTFIWSDSRDTNDLDALVRSLNRAIVTRAGAGATRRLPANRTVGQAFDLYLQGRLLWKLATPEAMQESAVLFRKAVEWDPGYGAAWAALAEALTLSMVLGGFDPQERARVREAAERACELNDGLPEAHVALGAALSLFDWDWEAGEREFQRALQVESRDAEAHVAYALQLTCRGLNGPAGCEIERALEIDPASLSTNFLIGWLAGVHRQYDHAISRHNLIIQLAPDFPLSYLGLGWAHIGKGSYGEALAHLTKAGNLLKNPALLAGSIGYCYARLGDHAEALHLIALLGSDPGSQATSWVGIASIHAGLGEIDSVFQCLARSVEQHDCSLPFQMLNPVFDSLRADRRFAGIAAEIGLDPALFTARA